MQIAARLGSLSLVSFFAVGCGYAEAMPPRAPAPELPRDVEPRTTPSEPGKTRVIIDADGERATVVDVVERERAVAIAGGVAASGTAEKTKPVCVTPCIVDLEPGMHVLRFASETDSDRVSEANVQVGDREKVVRHAIGRSESTSWAWTGSYLLTLLGTSAAILGGTLYGVGSTTSSISSDELRERGLWTLVGGGSAMVLGIPLMFLTRPVHQPGATTEIASR